MALIEILDLDSDDRHLSAGTESFLSEISATESGSIRGGLRHRHFARLVNAAVANIIDSSKISASIQSENTSQSDKVVRINTATDGTVTLDSTNVTPGSNFFYTNSGVAPIGGTPIPGVAGGYTF